MKIPIIRLCAFTLIYLFLLFGLAEKSDAQGHTFHPVGSSPESDRWAEKADPAIARGFSESVLYKFCIVSNCADGYDPLGDLVQDGAGNLYGTTFAGGASSSTLQW